MRKTSTFITNVYGNAKSTDINRRRTRKRKTSRATRSSWSWKLKSPINTLMRKREIFTKTFSPKMKTTMPQKANNPRNNKTEPRNNRLILRSKKREAKVKVLVNLQKTPPSQLKVMTLQKLKRTSLTMMTRRRQRKQLPRLERMPRMASSKSLKISNASRPKKRKIKLNKRDSSTRNCERSPGIPSS